MTNDRNASTLAKPYRAFSVGRIGAITVNTLTELTRLKVFYFLLVFALRDVDLYVVAGNCRHRATHSAGHRGSHDLHDSRKTGAAIGISAWENCRGAFAAGDRHFGDGCRVFPCALRARANARARDHAPNGRGAARTNR